MDEEHPRGEKVSAAESLRQIRKKSVQTWRSVWAGRSARALYDHGYEHRRAQLMMAELVQDPLNPAITWW